MSKLFEQEIPKSHILTSAKICNTISKEAEVVTGFGVAFMCVHSYKSCFPCVQCHDAGGIGKMICC